MKLCQYVDGVCIGCGHRTAISGLRRQCGQAAAHASVGVLSKVKNFAAAVAGHVAAGMPVATENEIARRHDICLGCEHLHGGTCTVCGCPVSLARGFASKLSWADQECPVGKWGKATPK